MRLFLLVQLKQFSTVEVEAAAFSDLDKPDLYYEYYSRIDPHTQQNTISNKVGSMVPFGFRLLLSELPQYLGKHHEAIDRLHILLGTIDKILRNLKDGKLENGHVSGPMDDKISSIRLWTRRKLKVLYSITNCAILQKDFELSIMTLEMLYEIADVIEEKMRIKSALGRVFLQLGDVTTASLCFAASKELRNQRRLSVGEKERCELIVDDLVGK